MSAARSGGLDGPPMTSEVYVSRTRPNPTVRSASHHANGPPAESVPVGSGPVPAAAAAAVAAAVRVRAGFVRRRFLANSRVSAVGEPWPPAIDAKASGTSRSCSSAGSVRVRCGPRSATPDHGVQARGTSPAGGVEGYIYIYNIKNRYHQFPQKKKKKKQPGRQHIPGAKEWFCE
jgi:hypothetical protein